MRDIKLDRCLKCKSKNIKVDRKFRVRYFVCGQSIVNKVEEYWTHLNFQHINSMLSKKPLAVGESYEVARRAHEVRMFCNECNEYVFHQEFIFNGYNRGISRINKLAGYEYNNEVRE